MIMNEVDTMNDGSIENRLRVENYDERIDLLLEKPYWLVDSLPKQVPSQAQGQYFRVEEYFMKDAEWKRNLYARFAHLLLKLNCYEEITVRIGEQQWQTNPDPASFVDMFLFGECGCRSIYVLLRNQDTLVLLNDEDAYMTLFNPDEALLELLRPLALSEGLFVWKGNSAGEER